MWDEEEYKRRLTAMTNHNQKAIELITRYGGIDGAHHKDWVLQQVLSVLLQWDKEKLKEFLKEREWEPGIPP
jgi:hypothetical protein